MRTLPLPAAAALAGAVLLAGCNTQPTTLTAQNDDPTANQIAAAPPVKLPPALTAQKQYRCADNSLLFVDFFDDKVSADIKTKKEGEVTKLTAPAAGQPFTGGGYTVAGSGSTVKITTPSKPAQSCNS